MASSDKGGKSVRLIKGQEVNHQQYGPVAEAATAQPFWDDPPYLDGKPLGIVGDLYGKSPWDRVTLNAFMLPGVWEATATPAIQLDVQRPNGFDGAALVSRGYIPAGITMTGQLWTPDQWVTFQRILPTFWTPPHHYAINDQKRAQSQVQGKETAISVVHPGLNAYNIHQLVIKQITPPEPTGQQGVRQIKIIAVEYVPEPQKKRSATKKVSGGKDRSVQAQQILGLGSSPYGKYVKATPENERKPPSKGQAHKT